MSDKEKKKKPRTQGSPAPKSLDNRDDFKELERRGEMLDYLKNEPIAKDYETPNYDSLKPQHQVFLTSFLECNDVREAALIAGYAPRTAHHRGFTLARRPDVVAAIEEVIAKQEMYAEANRSSLANRLLADSMVSIEDLVYWDANAGQHRIKEAKDVVPSFRRCLGLVSYSREFNVIFNNSAQAAARKTLTQMQGWLNVEASGQPAVSFSFGDLKDEPKESSK